MKQKGIDFNTKCRNRSCIFNAYGICKSRHENPCKGKIRDNRDFKAS